MAFQTDFPTLDRAALNELASIMEGAFAELLTAFMTDADAIVAGLQQAQVNDAHS